MKRKYVRNKDLFKGTGTISVRFEPEDRIRLEQVCRILQINCSCLIKRLVNNFYYESKDVLETALKKQKEVDNLFKDFNRGEIDDRSRAS